VPEIDASNLQVNLEEFDNSILFLKLIREKCDGSQNVFDVLNQVCVFINNKTQISNEKHDFLSYLCASKKVPRSNNYLQAEHLV
jgi:hypothetical protein